MKNIKFFILTVVFTCLTFGALAENNKNALVIEYLEISKTKETFDMTIEAYVNQLASQDPVAKKEDIRTFFNTYMGWNVLKEPSIKIVAAKFSEKELQDIIAFYKTSSGQAFANKSPEMAADLSNLIGSNMQKAMLNLGAK